MRTTHDSYERVQDSSTGEASDDLEDRRPSPAPARTGALHWTQVALLTMAVIFSVLAGVTLAYVVAPASDACAIHDELRDSLLATAGALCAASAGHSYDSHPQRCADRDYLAQWLARQQGSAGGAFLAGQYDCDGFGLYPTKIVGIVDVACMLYAVLTLIACVVLIRRSLAPASAAPLAPPAAREKK